MSDHKWDLGEYPGIKQFMRHWNRSWNESQLLLTWFSNCYSKIEVFIPKVNSHLLGLQGSEGREDYKFFISHDVYGVKRMLFEYCKPNQGFQIDSCSITEKYLESEGMLKTKLSDGLVKWLVAKFPEADLSINTFWDDMENSRKLDYILKKFMPKVFKGIKPLPSKDSSYLMAVETLLKQHNAAKYPETFTIRGSTNQTNKVQLLSDLLEIHFSGSSVEFFNDGSYKMCLLNWWAHLTVNYDDICIKNFGRSFANGLAVCAFLNNFKEGSINYATLGKENAVKNWEIAIAKAEELLGVPKLFDAEDVDFLTTSNSPLIMLYAFQCCYAVGGMIYGETFDCRVCYRKVSSRDSLVRHLETHLSCQTLESEWFDRIMLDQHRKLDQNRICCNIHFDTMAEYHLHCSKKHNHQQCNFDNCCYATESREDLVNHSRKHKMKLVCKSCSCGWLLGELLARHILANHQQDEERL